MFVWAIDVNTFTKLMNAGALYEVWIVVRDFCNIFFILVLLFSAFATIFQLDKYEYKKTIPLLIIMALLVNFSFPIARFVIDIANVPMYFFAQNVFGGSPEANTASAFTSGKFAEGLLGSSNIQKILIPGIEGTTSISSFSTTHLLAATICMFLFGASFLTLAVLMVVRMISLAILVMFAPIGFVGMITPALQSYARDWWSKLFKWAFYGPIAVMLTLIAIIVMREAGALIYPNYATGGAFVSSGNSVNDSMVSAVAFFAIPIVLFWIAITWAEKSSNDISGLGIKWGSNAGRKMGNWVRRGWHAPITYPLRQLGITGGVKQAIQDRANALGFGKEALASRERRWAVRAGGGDAAQTRLDQENKKLVDDAAKKKGMVDLDPDKLNEIVQKGNTHEKAAALIELADRNLATQNDLNTVRNLFGENSQVSKVFESKMRNFNPVAAFTDKNGVLNTKQLESYVATGKIDWKKISDKSLTPQLLEYAFKAKTITNKDFEELRSKGGAYATQIKTALDGAITKISQDIKDSKIKGVDSNGSEITATDWKNLKDFDVLRNIQSAHVAQTGEFHKSIDSEEEAKKVLFQRGDGDSLKRLKSSVINSNLNLITENVRGKYVDIISKMAETGDDGLVNAKIIKDHINSNGNASGSKNIDQLKRLNNDHRVRNI